jgi:hypothetical protein
VPRGRPAPSGAQDPPHRRLADSVTEPAQFTVHPAIFPGWVLPDKPLYQVADLRAGARPAWPVRVRPFACDQLAVPGQQCARRDEPMGAQHSWEQPGQRRQDRPVGPVRPGPGDLTAEHRDRPPGSQLVAGGAALIKIALEPGGSQGAPWSGHQVGSPPPWPIPSLEVVRRLSRRPTRTTASSPRISAGPRAPGWRWRRAWTSGPTSPVIRSRPS